MISPKEKAVELVDKYIEMNQLHSSNTKEEYGNSYLYHIKCALISVDEILNNFGLTADGKTHYTTYSAFEYYTKVKLELINMKSKQ